MFFPFLGITAFLVYKSRVASLVRSHMNGLIPYEKTTEIMLLALKQITASNKQRNSSLPNSL